MKKLTSILLVFLLVFSLSACQSGEVNPHISSSVSNSEVLPIEVKEFNYTVEDGYLYCAVTLHNPNIETAIELPTFRVTARDEASALLGTEDQTLSIIYPQQDFVFATSFFAVDKAPTSVSVEVLKSEDYNIVHTSTLNKPEYTPLSAINTSYKEDRIIGEIKNANSYDIEDAVVVVVFKDANGKAISGTSTFIENIAANSTAPFDMSIYESFATSNFEVYANIW